MGILVGVLALVSDALTSNRWDDVAAAVLFGIGMFAVFYFWAERSKRQGLSATHARVWRAMWAYGIVAAGVSILPSIVIGKLTA
ncbi:MAG: hypothetical protein GEU78_20365 [Actinobacteria bacterium]|nr:hypothetical protein [Actinomycetota bacterium]